MQKVCSVLNGINLRIGSAMSWLLAILMSIVIMEVVLRYFFSSPTIWGWDVILQVQALIVISSGIFTFVRRGHVSIDFLLNKFNSEKKDLILVIIDFIVLLSISFLLWEMSVEMVKAVKLKQEFSSAWMPPIYPLKVVVTAGLVLMFFQSVCYFTTGINRLVGKRRKLDE